MEVLASYWMRPPRHREGSGAGALAGLITASGSAPTLTSVRVVRLSVVGTEAALRSQFGQPPAGMGVPWRDLGVGPATPVSPALGIVGSAICCGLGILLAAALGAVGGAVSAFARGARAASVTAPDRHE